MSTRLIIYLLFALVSVGSAHATSIWTSSYGEMTLQQSGSDITGTYATSGGEITGTLSGNILTGWWRETDNEKSCGPGNAWSGLVLFAFASDGRSFTGDWSYCSAVHSELNANAAAWTGSLSSGSIDVNDGGPPDCVASIAYAQHPIRGTWVAFPTPCDVPAGWTITMSRPDNYQALTGALDATWGAASSLAGNLDLSLPYIVHQNVTGTVTFWADLEYLGAGDSGDLTWQLSEYGVLDDGSDVTHSGTIKAEITRNCYDCRILNNGDSNWKDFTRCKVDYSITNTSGTDIDMVDFQTGGQDEGSGDWIVDNASYYDWELSAGETENYTVLADIPVGFGFGSWGAWGAGRFVDRTELINWQLSGTCP